jgi:hypothetical protein
MRVVIKMSIKHCVCFMMMMKDELVRNDNDDDVS